MKSKEISLYRIINGKPIEIGELFSVGDVLEQSGASCTAYQGMMDDGKGRKVVLKKQHREAGEEFASYLERVISDWKENQAAQNLSSTQSFTDYGIFADKETCLWLVQQQQAGTRLDHLSLDDLTLQDVFEMADSLLRYAKDIVDNGALPTDLKPANIWVPYAGGKRERRVTFFDVNSVALRKERIKTVSDTWRPFEGSEHYPGFPESYGEWSVTYTIGLIILYLLLEKEDREQLILRVKNGNEAIYTYPFEHFRTGHDILHGKLAESATAFFSKAFAYGASIDELKVNRFTVEEMQLSVQEIAALMEKEKVKQRDLVQISIPVYVDRADLENIHSYQAVPHISGIADVQNRNPMTATKQPHDAAKESTMPYATTGAIAEPEYGRANAGAISVEKIRSSEANAAEPCKSQNSLSATDRKIFLRTCSDLYQLHGLTELDVARRIMANDAARYGSDNLGRNAGSADLWAAHMRVAPGNWLFACDEEGKIVGNWSYSFIPHEQEEQMLTGMLLGEDVAASSATYPRFVPDKEVAVFLMYIGINDPAYRNENNWAVLWKSFGNQMLKLIQSGCFCKGIYARLYLQEEIDIYKHLGFVQRSTDSEGGIIYYLDLTTRNSHLGLFLPDVDMEAMFEEVSGQPLIFRQLSHTDVLTDQQLADISALVYDTDKWIYPALFSSRNQAKRLLPLLFEENSDSMFKLDNIFACFAKNRVVGIILHNKGPLHWSAERLKVIADLMDESLPATCSKVEQEYFMEYQKTDPNSTALINVCVHSNWRMRDLRVGTHMLSEFLKYHPEQLELYVLKETTAAMRLYMRGGFQIKCKCNGFSTDNRELPCFYMVRPAVTGALGKAAFDAQGTPSISKVPSVSLHDAPTSLREAHKRLSVLREEVASMGEKADCLLERLHQYSNASPLPLSVKMHSEYSESVEIRLHNIISEMRDKQCQIERLEMTLTWAGNGVSVDYHQILQTAPSPMATEAEEMHEISNWIAKTNASLVAIEEDIKKGHFLQPLERLGLSRRTLLCLQQAGISTMIELLTLARLEDIFKIKNLGRRSCIEIATRLEKLGVRDSIWSASLYLPDDFWRYKFDELQSGE